MLFKDEHDYPIDQTGDGMDSSVRAGIIGMCKGHSGSMIEFRNYERHPQDEWGMFVRHPDQYPANNYRNYTRDQAKVFLAGVHRIAKDCPGINYRSMVKRFFWRRFKSFFFMQNTERDRLGSVKRFRPHAFYKDSKQTQLTYEMVWSWKKLQWVLPADMPTYDDTEVYEIETRLIDGPDLMLPNDIGEMIIVGRIWQFYWFMPMAYLFHYVSLMLNYFSSGEQNQIFAESYVYNTLEIYKFFQPKWRELLFKYWGRRNEVEYAIMMIEFGDK